MKIWEVDFPVLNEICWEQFTKQGLDMNRFSTSSNAPDAVELIKALGNKERLRGTDRHCLRTGPGGRT